MAEGSTPGSAGDAGITITRVFDAPRERVWREWTEPDAFADWFGGTQSDVPLETVSMDVRPGGAWRLTMFTDPGHGESHWKGEYIEVVEPERLVFTVSDRPGDEPTELVTVVLNDLGDDRTEMRFEQRGEMTAEQYKRAGQGWSGFFDRIAERLAAG
ncbi:MAG: SRPBCC family protein [Solirubrobacterales bacterium]